MRKKNIVLIGFMGCGKSSVGVNLSYKLKTPVEDTDKLIEQREGTTISSIFATKGEQTFRLMETELLKTLIADNRCRVYSVGGGTPVNPVNRPLLKKLGTVVYLKAKPETIFSRLSGDTTRPLLQCENPFERIQSLLAQREAAYRDCADIVIEVDGLSVSAVSDLILDRVQKLIKKEHGQELKATRENAREINPGVNEGHAQNGDKYRRMKLLVINGPNINFLGIREKTVYGTQDYTYLCNLIENHAKERGIEVEIFQSNHEGAIIDRIQESYFDGTEGIVINPGAYTHYSYAIRDALASIVVPKVEIHISDITQREEFRKVSVTAPVCNKQIYGQGLEGYLQAIDYILQKN